MQDDNRPVAVDPSVLTDDRDNKDLLTFEKTWGHRLLAGLGAAMLVVAAVVVIYCIINLVRISALVDVADEIVLYGRVLYGTGLVCGLLIIAPAVVAIRVAKRPHKIMIAIVFGIIGILCAVGLVASSLAMGTQNPVGTMLYGALFALFPVVYLIAALKVRSSNN